MRQKEGASRPWSPKKGRIIKTWNSLDEVEGPESLMAYQNRLLLNASSSSLCKSMWKPWLTTVRWPRPGLSNPRSTNYIVWALNVRTQYYFGAVTNWVLTVTYFENITVELYVLKTHVKFHANRILFTIWSINFFLCTILY